MRRHQGGEPGLPLARDDPRFRHVAADRGRQPGALPDREPARAMRHERCLLGHALHRHELQGAVHT
jgi:hypothetical protein